MKGLVRYGTVVVFTGVVLAGRVWAAEGAEHGANWGDLLLRCINFAILVGVLYKLLKKPIVNYFTARRRNIQQLLEEMEKRKEEAERKCAEYKAKLALLDQEVEKIVKEYVEQGERERAKIIEAAERQAEYIKQQAQLAIQQEMKAAKEALRAEVAELTVKAAEDMLKERIGDEDQTRLVEEFMIKVVEAK
ncbi:F0F1 ATP synthase subunit B [Thermodesulforhabdus norvegica]|uniref:ATP synthase subunit b n=1 Tax=Thermodesulforhabdus norvegica TaxID=39841 RepID=A0A1I4VD05_9BACT|nr:F0F1 ATP synthase subunit B [Thermodesulforhabdus norvegica]SFM99045.1 F-type H+-transporting ATPase subunit b [Thermodesulforhabdus norvegica]